MITAKLACPIRITGVWYGLLTWGVQNPHGQGLARRVHVAPDISGTKGVQREVFSNGSIYGSR